MADPRTRPYPSTSSHSNGPPASRERAFNDIFNTGRPNTGRPIIPPAHSQSHAVFQNGNGNGNGNANFSGSSPPKPSGGGYHQDSAAPGARNHLPPRQMPHPSAL